MNNLHRLSAIFRPGQRTCFQSWASQRAAAMQQIPAKATSCRVGSRFRRGGRLGRIPQLAHSNMHPTRFGIVATAWRQAWPRGLVCSTGHTFVFSVDRRLASGRLLRCDTAARSTSAPSRCGPLVRTDLRKGAGKLGDAAQRAVERQRDPQRRRGRSRVHGDQRQIQQGMAPWLGKPHRGVVYGR